MSGAWKEAARIVQVKLSGSTSPHFIILSCHGEKLYITIALSMCCLNSPYFLSLSFSLSIVSTESEDSRGQYLNF